MKQFVLFLMLMSSYIVGQNYGVSLGYSSSEAVFGDIFYTQDVNSFHIGYTYKSSNAKGKEISEQKSNYGKTIDGTGSYYTSVDLGYGYLLLEKLRVNVELSFSTKKYYTNYVDGRFSGGGYHMITKDETEMGVGGLLGYNINNFDLFVGLNTIRKMTFGLRYVFKY